MTKTSFHQESVFLLPKTCCPSHAKPINKARKEEKTRELCEKKQIMYKAPHAIHYKYKYTYNYNYIKE